MLNLSKKKGNAKSQRLCSSAKSKIYGEPNKMKIPHRIDTTLILRL